MSETGGTGPSTGIDWIKADEHGGNLHRLKRCRQDGTGLIDFSANINPLGPPAWLRSLVNRELESVVHYPDPDCCELIEIIARQYRLAEELIVPANGTTELLHLLPEIIGKRPVVIPHPSYIDYQRVFENHGFEIRPLILGEDQFHLQLEQISTGISGGEAVIFGNPVNPTGSVCGAASIQELARCNPQTLFIVDEAFYEFHQPFTTAGGSLENLITLNSLTKFFGVPGLRIGFGIFPEPYRRRLKRLLPTWSVNSLAQSFAARALQDEEYCRKSRQQCRLLREELTGWLTALPELRVFPGAANYLLLKSTSSISSEELYQSLLKHGLVIRRCGNYRGLDPFFFRVAVRTRPENQRLLEALEPILTRRPGKRSARRKARSVMFQGTSSNAGKSILAAAFCRIFRQDGLAVAPFKAQNMSLNSYVTTDGGEMGRAQVVQALAAGIEPDWRMNPVLLKPNSETGSQVIVRGKVVGNMEVRGYHAYKQQAWSAAAACYDELADEFECLVIEGAGSPGEVNLKQHDFVNMQTAAHAGAPVLLVGDIDRGGVYASFAGIMDVLEEWERGLVAGFVVNKFRGDPSLLDPAHDFIAQHTGREVLGVVPYIGDLALPQEDSVALRSGYYRQRNGNPDKVPIVVVDLPHIANYTDIDALHGEPDVELLITADPGSLEAAAAVILPGSKNVGGDLGFLRERGFYQALRRYAENGGFIVGICGGYQMLGRTIQDPHGIEGTESSFEGLGLLQTQTVLQPEKTLVRSVGTHLPSGRKVCGYEIHHGLTEGSEQPILSFGDHRRCGDSGFAGRVWGAYLHGIFDEDEFRRWFLDELRQHLGMEPLGMVVAPYRVEDNLDRLADIVRGSFDMQRIYRLVGL